MTKEVTSATVKAVPLSSQDGLTNSGPSSSNFAIWEKRQMKAMRKLRQGLVSALQSCQLHYDVKASMEEDDEDEEMGPSEIHT